MSKDKKKMRSSKYTREFRDSSVQLVINSDESTAKIAKDSDVNEQTLTSREQITQARKRYPKKGNSIFRQRRGAP